MAWIESHQTLQRHPKTTRAALMLKISRVEMIGHLHCLWWWALDFSTPDGCLGRDISPEMLANAAEFPEKKAEIFLNALKNCGAGKAGFIEEIDGMLYLHNWNDYAGKLIEQRNLSTKQRSLGGKHRMEKLSPEERKLLSQQANNARWSSQLTSEDIPATVPNHTVPNTNKEINKENVTSDDAKRLSELLKTLILQNNPIAKVPEDINKWAKDIDLMINKEKRPPDAIESVIRFSQSDNFWKGNILSANKLREKFDQLFVKMNTEFHTLKKDGGQNGTNQQNNKKLQSTAELVTANERFMREHAG